MKRNSSVWPGTMLSTKGRYLLEEEEEEVVEEVEASEAVEAVEVVEVVEVVGR